MCVYVAVVYISHMYVYCLCYFPKALPKVPVPELETTMAEYLRLLEPVLTPSHHDKTKAIVNQFISGPGPMLQKYLQDKREADLNWVSLKIPYINR